MLDISTTEVCDLLMGGVMSAGEGRLDAIARTRVPYVGSCGALDMVNFGPATRCRNVTETASCTSTIRRSR